MNKNIAAFVVILVALTTSAQEAPRANSDLHFNVQEYLEKNYTNLGLVLHDVENWVVTDNYTSSSTGIRHFYITQTINGISVQNGIANITLDSNDNVLYVSNRLVANLKAKNNGISVPNIDASSAIIKAAQHIGASGEFGNELVSKTVNQHQFDGGSLSKEEISVTLKYWNTGEELRLVWIVSLYEPSGIHWWQIFIDAESGEELNRLDWVQQCDFGHNLTSNLEHSIAAPMMPAPPPGSDQYNVFALPIESPNHGAISLEVGPFNSTASPFGWHDDDGIAGEEYTITRGNNVHAYEDISDNDSPGYSPDGGATLDFNFPLNLAQAPLGYQDVAITNLFYVNNRIHDILYQYGFDEASGNFQENNYGNGGLQSDYVYAEAQDGGGMNNANFATPADGSNPRMQMYLWSDSPFDLDGDFDNGIVIHEYGHGVSNRLTGGPSNSGCLGNSEQMGEGWSDFLACALTTDILAANPVYRPIGTYATGEAPSGIGIRNAPYDTSFVVNNYTYADVADVANISQPHGIGFVWATMLWDLNWAFIDQDGFDSNIETGTGGNNTMLQLVLEGLKLQPCSPGFVDGRDAILLADQLLNGGANQCLIWTSFAKRGLGFSASQGSSGSRTDQVEAFDIPVFCQTPLIPPTSNFDANVYVTCTGEVQFEDLSTDVPQTWQWTFGDGAVDNIQNPTHTYGAAGFYDVTLTVSNIFGNDTQTISSFIEVTIPDMPISQDVDACGYDSIVLSATASDLIHWTDLSGNILGTGPDFSVTLGPVSSSYYAVNVVDYPNYNVDPIDTLIGTGGNHNSGFYGAINFDADAALTIYSAKVYSGSTGIRTISLWDSHTSGGGGTAIQVINVDIPFVGEGRIDLNFEVPGPGQYSIGLNDADLYRNNAGASYPYVQPGLMSIVSSSASSGFYYYFYDLEVGIPSCASDSLLVTANVTTAADFSWVTTLMTADFTNLSTGGVSWDWDFGDGNSSTAQDPSHTYAANGIYTVTLTVNGCVAQYLVNIGGVGIESIVENDFDISLFPNPAANETRITFSKTLNTNSTLQIFSVEGKLIDEIKIAQGTNEVVISLIGMAPQVYYLVLDHENGQERKKLVVQK